MSQRCLTFLFLLIFSQPLLAEEKLMPELIISGIENEREENVRAFVNLSRLECDEPNWRLEKVKSDAIEKTQQALRALGYYRPVIEASIQRDAGCWVLAIHAQQGPQVTIASVSIQMPVELAQLDAMKTLLDDFPLRRQRDLNHADYQSAKSQLIKNAYRYGFFESVFKRHELKVDPVQGTASILLQLDTGPRYRLGDVNISQEDAKDRFIQQFIRLKQGDWFDSREISRQQQILNDSGYFSQVEINADQSANSAAEVPVEIRLTARKQYAYRIGAGISTDIGVRGSFRMENRRVNRRGHTYLLDSTWSPVVSETDFNYGIPLGDSGQYRVDLGAGFRRENTDTSTSTLYKLGAGLTRQMSEGWKRTLSLDWSREDFEVADISDITTLLIPGVSWSKTVRDHPLYPSRGWRVYLNISAASEKLFSDVDMLQVNGSLKTVHTFDKLRLIGRVGAGSTRVNDFDKLPTSLRFFAGGDSSVRGFSYKSLGPVNDNDEVTGGRHYLAASAEIDFPFRNKWSVAAFFDAGNAFNDLRDYELKKSVGIGIRFHSPIGPIRLDVAQDLDREKGLRLHISMGPDL